MEKVNKMIGLVTGTVLAFAVFTGTVSNVLAADNTQVVKQNYQHMGAELQLGRTSDNMQDAIANFLGMDRSHIFADRQAGKSMVQIAKEQGKSEEGLYDFVFNQRKAQIDQMVANGRISAETANAHETIMKERIKQNMNRTDVGYNCNGNGRTKDMGYGKHMGNGQGCRAIN